ncbi:MAG: hypothetical protein AABY16_04645 [Nanoarchaeota archaeon]
MTFDLEGRVPAYETADRSIRFVANMRDEPDAYDVILNQKSHLYIPSRTLNDLTGSATSTEEVMRILDATNNNIAATILEITGVSPEKMHIALLHLRIAEQEKEIEAAYRTAREK